MAAVEPGVRLTHLEATWLTRRGLRSGIGCRARVLPHGTMWATRADSEESSRGSGYSAEGLCPAQLSGPLSLTEGDPSQILADVPG